MHKATTQTFFLLLAVLLAGLLSASASLSVSSHTKGLNLGSSLARINYDQLRTARVGGVTPPTILPQFTSKLDVSYINVKMTPASTNLTFDRVNMHMLLTYNYDIYGEVLAVQEYSIYNSTWINENGQCELIDKEFADLFGWLPYASYGGTDTINGVNCQEWYIALPEGKLTIYTNGNIPVRMLVPIVNTAYEVLDFDNVRSGVPATFKVPQECFHPETCSVGITKIMTVYNIHHSDNSLTNSNGANLLGEATYLCVSGYYYNQSYLSQYSVAVNTTWGQYRLCENGKCSGESTLVGHRASYGLGDQGLQCELSSKFGDWFTFTKQGQCSNGKARCSWTLLSLYKTISMKCLIETLDFHSACQKDGGFPFSKAASLLEGAFSSNIPSQGGCPSVTPSADRDVVNGLRAILN